MPVGRASYVVGLDFEPSLQQTDQRAGNVLMVVAVADEEARCPCCRMRNKRVVQLGGEFLDRNRPLTCPQPETMKCSHEIRNLFGCQDRKHQHVLGVLVCDPHGRLPDDPFRLEAPGRKDGNKGVGCLQTAEQLFPICRRPWRPRATSSDAPFPQAPIEADVHWS